MIFPLLDEQFISDIRDRGVSIDAFALSDRSIDAECGSNTGPGTIAAESLR